MKFQGNMIIVSDIEKSKQFYTDVLKETITMDLGGYVVMGGFSMMARKNWIELTKDDQIPGKSTGHHFELYFEESRLDEFVADLKGRKNIKELHPLVEAPWGQRTIRFLDPDCYVIEVSEPMEDVVLRLLASGMSVQETSEKSMMPVEFIENCINERDKRS
jgi:Lactoylglutathione lyase and related lyases